MTPNQLKVFIGLSRALNPIDRSVSTLVRQYGLTHSQFAVLEALYHKGDMSVGEVQEKILTTSGNIPVIVNNLSADGLLERRRDPSDGRRTILHLTDRGRVLMEKVFPEVSEAIIEKIDVLEENEQAELLRLIKKLGGR